MKRTEPEDQAVAPIEVQPTPEKKEKPAIPDFTKLESWHTFVVADLEFHCRDHVTLYANASHLTHIPYFRNLFTDCKRESGRMIIDISEMHHIVIRVLLYQAYGFPKHAAGIICRTMQNENSLVIDEMLTFFDKIIYDPSVQLVYEAIDLLKSCPVSILPILIKHSKYGNAKPFTNGFQCFERAFLQRMEILIGERNVPVVLVSVATEELIKYYLSLEYSNRQTKLEMMLSMGADNLAKVLTSTYLTRFPVSELVQFMYEYYVHEHPKLCQIFIEALHSSKIPSESSFGSGEFATNYVGFGTSTRFP